MLNINITSDSYRSNGSIEKDILGKLRRQYSEDDQLIRQIVGRFSEDK